MAKKTLAVVFNSKPIQIREGSTTLDVAGQTKDVGADFIWIFAGARYPSRFWRGWVLPSDAKISAAPPRRKPRPGIRS